MRTATLGFETTGTVCYVIGAFVMIAYLAYRGVFTDWTSVVATIAALLAFALAYALGTRRAASRALASPSAEAPLDSLTGVATRSVLFTRLDAALASARRRRHDVAVLYIDFDGMRRANDRLGHAGGDAVLAEIGARLRSAVRSDETVARVGGDEFVVLLPHVEKFNEPEEAARRISGLFAEPIVVRGEQLAVSASIGIARSPYDGLDRDRLLEAADTAMYAIKH